MSRDQLNDVTCYINRCLKNAATLHKCYAECSQILSVYGRSTKNKQYVLYDGWAFLKLLINYVFCALSTYPNFLGIKVSNKIGNYLIRICKKYEEPIKTRQIFFLIQQSRAI